ncbi:mechanosensitive ion channel [Campylobacter jejuni]|nr:mechanosensitive ion channel [Campylobacter jejuni]
MKKIILLLIFCTALFANKTIGDELNEKITSLDKAIENSIWNVRYENFIKYQELKTQINFLNSELDKANSNREKEEILRKIGHLEEQLSLLAEYKELNFAKFLSLPDSVESLPKLTNPFAIISGLSHIRKLRNAKEEYLNRFKEFQDLFNIIKEKNEELKTLVKLNPSNENFKLLKASDKKLEEFEQALNFSEVSFSVYEKNVDEEIQRVRSDIKTQSLRAINIVAAIIFVLIVSFLLKIASKKYISDNERYYTANKIINFINISIIFLILLFAYIENITYLVTVLGFASAGLAIAMKDMFMSMLGWCVIIFGSSFRVGDRIKVWQNNTTYVGDIIDISFLRMTIYEDITLTTYTTNRRSGRIIFIPNNYIFTGLIANYTHHGMKTIWDGIDITISFDSNHNKAMAIVEQVVTKHAKNYTDLAKKGMGKLRNEYSIRNLKVEPRFFMFFEEYGMRISAWYMNNSYTALVLRSKISREIISEFNKCEDIKISYPSQNLYLSNKEKPILEEQEGSLF